MLISICINSHAEPCKQLLSNYMYMAIYADLFLPSTGLLIWNATNYTLYIIRNISQIYGCHFTYENIRKRTGPIKYCYIWHIMGIGTFINTALRLLLWTAWCNCSGFTGYGHWEAAFASPKVGTFLQTSTWYMTKMDFHSVAITNKMQLGNGIHYSTIH